MTIAEINAYLDWRAEREGMTIDVSPEAYERHLIVEAIIDAISNWSLAGDDHFMLGVLGRLVTDYYGMGE